MPELAEVPLADFARIEETAAPLSIAHQSGTPASTISFNLAPGVSLSQANDAIRDAMLAAADQLDPKQFGPYVPTRQTAIGEVVVDDRGATSVPGVFAAGDCTTVPYKQIVIAAGEGAKAALSAFDHLIRHT